MGGMCGVDFGGPIGKTASLFANGLLVDGIYGPEAVKEYLISQKPDHLVTTEYQIKYVDENGRVLNVVKGTGRAGTTVTPKKKTFEGYELDQEITPFTLNKISSQTSLRFAMQDIIILR